MVSVGKLAAALAVLGLATAAPKPHCVNSQTCVAAAASPAPEDVYCAAAGQVHLEPTVVIADVTQKGWTASDCAQSCLVDDACHSIAFDAARQRCLTLRDVPRQMGFRAQDDADFAFWNRACWTEQCRYAVHCSTSTTA